MQENVLSPMFIVQIQKRRSISTKYILMKKKKQAKFNIIKFKSVKSKQTLLIMHHTVTLGKF